MPCQLFGGIEAGGTKFVCAVGTGPGDIRSEIRFSTTTPDETLARAVVFFKEQEKKHGSLAGLGIGAFGPLDPDPTSPKYGFITTTPKKGWADTDVAGVFRREFKCPVAFDTDVNAAAIGEWKWGAGRGVDIFVYITVGTGIGGGVIVNGKPLHGLIHPEMGHVMPPHDRKLDPFDGICPYHGDCLEGLANGPAIEKRWGASAKTLPHDHPAWKIEAGYLAWAAANLVCTVSPQRIILGGGVMDQTHLFPLIHAETRRLLNGYVKSTKILDHMDDYVVPPLLGNRAGVLGAMGMGVKVSEIHPR